MLFVIFLFYIADFSTNIETYCSADQAGEFVEMFFYCISMILLYLNQYLSYDILDIFHFYLADLSTNVEPYCSPDQFSELLICLLLYIHDYII